jgi:hypothetical protein
VAARVEISKMWERVVAGNGGDVGRDLQRWGWFDYLAPKRLQWI